MSSSRGHARRLGRSSAPPRTNRSCRGCRVAPTTAIRAYRPSMRPVLKVAKGSEAQIQTGPLPAVRLDGRLEGDNDRGCDRSRPELRVGCKGMKAVRRWLRRVLRSMGKAGCDEATSGLHVRARSERREFRGGLPSQRLADRRARPPCRRGGLEEAGASAGQRAPPSAEARGPQTRLSRRLWPGETAGGLERAAAARATAEAGSPHCHPRFRASRFTHR